jgi:hypothetical protein
MSSVQRQQQLPADDTTTQVSSSSVLGNGHVEEMKKKMESTEDDVVERRSGLVSLRRGVEVQEEREQRPGQEETEGGGTQGGEVLLAPEHNSLDAQAVADWTMPVEWTGTVRERNVAGADVGNRLYAGKKRMFKGHKWERMRERRVSRTKMLLRDMDERIQRFKGVRNSSRLRDGNISSPLHLPPLFSSVFHLPFC